VAAVNDGAGAVQAAVDFTPDVVILDIAMPGVDGIHAARQMKQLGLTAKVIFLTVHEDADYVRAARAIGASYVRKPRMHVDLLLAIKEALAGRIFVSPSSSPVSEII